MKFEDEINKIVLGEIIKTYNTYCITMAKLVKKVDSAKTALYYTWLTICFKYWERLYVYRIALFRISCSTRPKMFQISEKRISFESTFVHKAGRVDD